MLLTEQVFLLHHKGDKASLDFRERSLPTPTTLQSQYYHFLPVRQLLAPGPDPCSVPLGQDNFTCTCSCIGVSNPAPACYARTWEAWPVTLAYGEVK